jgi:lipopolysaccharide transport system ATP-binding protein
MSVAITIENLSKQYRLGLVSTRTLSHDLNRWWLTAVLGKDDPYLKIGDTNDRATKGDSEYVWALKDINLKVEEGEVLGIIGKNGAGKSTLLKILSKVTAPTTGIIKARGLIASLLEVGTGFHQEMTGRENIYLNGAILGMTKAEISKKLDEIIDFAGVERYIDTPVKRYSSGMMVRLGFAVAAHLEPEILIVDEVLAVGDAEFQKKAIGKMQDVSRQQGRTVLFVSHNMTAVQNLCPKSLVLENGKISFNGNSLEAIGFYERGIVKKAHWVGEDGDSFIKIKETKVINDSSSEKIKNSSKIEIKLKLELFTDFNDLVIGFTLKSVYGNSLASVLYNDFNDYSALRKGTYEILFRIPPYILATGEYSINFNISIPFVKLINSEKINLSFKVIAESYNGNKYFIENDKDFNSIFRPNWFSSITKVS